MPDPGAPQPPAFRPDAAGGHPHEANAALLARGPVVSVVLPGDVPAFAVVGHAALKELLTHPDVAKNARHFTALREGRIPDGWPLRTFATVPGMTTADGDDHRRLRALVAQAFTPRRVEELRPRVEELTEELLDGLERAAASAGGVADLRQHFAMPLPMAVVCELLGAGPQFRDRLHRLATALVSTGITPQEALAANREMAQVLGAVARAKRARPGDDLVSALIAAREADDDRLSESELIGTLLQLVVAGHQTTLNLVTNAVRALTGTPGQLALLRAGRAEWADVVEETLRWDGPVNLFPFRYPTRDITLAGTPIPRGTPILAGYGAAGRDRAAHGPDADRFDAARRTDARHLALGHGVHYCLGAPLARMEAAVALSRLFARFPDLEPALPEEELARHPSFVGNSVQRLPVRLRPA